MKKHVQFIELGEKLRIIADLELDLTDGAGLPIKGDIVYLIDKGKYKQFWVVERHWQIGNVVGMIRIYVVSTSEQAKTITG
jgi:hypothetical protein